MEKVEQRYFGRSSVRLLQGAIGRLLADCPFYGSLAMRLPLVQADLAGKKVKTIGCDGRRILYNHEWVAGYADMADLKVAIAHVVTACALEHHLRRGDRDYAVWQEASRGVTGVILGMSGICRIPRYSYYGDDRSVEELYNDLLGRQQREQERQEEEKRRQEEQEKQEQQEAGGAEGDDGDGGDGSGSGGNGNADGAGNGGDSSEEAGDAEEADQGEEEDKQSDTHGPIISEYGPVGEVLDAPEGTDPHEEAMAMNLASRAALELTGQYGKEVPGGLREFIKSAGNAPDMSWQDVLKEHMNEIRRGDYSWVPPNNRYVWQDMYLPSMKSEGSGHIAVVIDTSGSINEASLRMFWAGVKEMMDEVTPTGVTVICCDMAVHSVHEFTPDDLPDVLDTSGGGGGTCFTDVWPYIANTPETPEAVLFWTDLCVPEPNVGDDPGVPVIWLKVRDDYGYNRGITPKFGVVIELGGKS